MHMIFFFLELMKIFRGNSDGYLSGRRNFLGIFSFNRTNQPPNILQKLKLKIPRKFRRIKYSEEMDIGPRNIPTNTLPRNIPTAKVSRNISTVEVRRNILGIFNSRYSLRIFRRKISDDHSRRYVLGIPLFRGHTDDICRRNPGVFL
ncbi:hypothetical protein IGI04_035020 [Brassica rapa subsp. trilocularis]|uniref:Uncharacterized protein n=1 Tax=Brassica rapa subsp. trilocularis TaxID=1813537 RepID=A0ABQ7LAF1_BRACM|nr:hypothetical protein IGI04_035020 [Brassica rapa subsp. trilocularis]